MFNSKLFLLFLAFYIVPGNHGDWVADWMSPVHELMAENQARRSSHEGLKVVETEEIPQIHIPSSNQPKVPQRIPGQRSDDDITLNLKVKLENTLQTAEEMAKTLRAHILELVAREALLKNAIANGRSGVTTVTVQTLNQAPRIYIVREGNWYLCRGMVQKPTEMAPTHRAMMRAPRCIGQEITSDQDPCVFNSLIKYETVPQRRHAEYAEDHFLCVKSSFNSSLERYLSVPRHVVNETCTTGSVRNLDENMAQCGLRMMSEYTFYPEESAAAAELPLEYCTERDGSCKLIVAWHISNTTIENFEFLKNEYNFKKYFLKPGPIKHLV